MSEAVPTPPVPTPTPTPTPAPAPTPAPKGFDTTSGLIGAAGGVVLTLVVGAVALGWFAWSPGPPAPKPPLILQLVTDKPHVGRRIQIHADTLGKTVKWQILSGPTAAENYDFWSEDGGTHDQDLTTPIAGNYRVQAITVVSGEPEAAEIMVPVDVGPGPGPVPPGPTPGPIPAGQLRVLMTYDEDAYQTDQAMQKVLNDTTLRKYIFSKGDGKFLSNKVVFTDEPAMKIWRDTFQHQKQLGITIFNGENGQVAYEGPLPKTVDEAMTLVKKYGG